MLRRTAVLIAGFLALIVLLAGCPNFTQDTDPVLGEFEPVRPNDTRYGEQWNLGFIAMEQAWGVLHSDEVQAILSSDGLPRDVVVAVLDTAIDVDHPDLQGVLVDGYDATVDGGAEISVSSSAVRPQDLPSPEDHGSHVAGIIGANTDNEDGIAGIGWLPGGARVRIMPVTVLDSGGAGELEDVIEGLQFAAGMLSDYKPERPADAINLSLGGGGSAGMQELLEDIRDSGTTVLAAAGNSGCSAPVIFPAAYASTIAVGSANPPDDIRAFYSNCGDQLDIAAPGGSGEDGDFGTVFSLAHTNSGGDNDEYTTMAGTSMATPHVAGVAALLYAISNDMTPAAARQILTETVSPVTRAGALPNEEYGWGVLNAERAVRRALMKPYGPYRNDGSATVHESWPFAPLGNLETEITHSTSLPPEGTYATDRAALVLERDWYERTSSVERRKRLDRIAEAHDLDEIPDRGHRFLTAYLPDGEEVSSELLENLRQESEIRTADFSVYFYRQ